MDSGLDVMERNVLQAELRGSFAVRDVEEVLRKHWGDYDLKKRDQDKGRHLSHLADAEDQEDDQMACFGQVDPLALEAEGFGQEDIEAMLIEGDRAEEAYAMIQEGRRTLRDARAKQHAVKMSRKFFPVSSKMPSGVPASTKPLKCFRCGGPHKIAQCTEKPKDRSGSEQANVVATTEEAPFVFLAEAFKDEQVWMSEGCHTGGPEEAWLSTQEVVAQGKAVLDGGATKSIGSVHALSKVLELNENKRGHDGLQDVDLSDRPSFGFGNSSRDQCVSTASLGVPLDGRTSTLKIHALDKGQAPILMSIHSLRKLGAVVDFEHDLAVFRHVNARKLLRLERSSAGHQVMPLTEDVFEGAVNLPKAFPSLREFS